MQEGTTSRVMATDRLYGEFYDFYRVSPKNFGYHLVMSELCSALSGPWQVVPSTLNQAQDP